MTELVNYMNLCLLHSLPPLRAPTRNLITYLLTNCRWRHNCRNATTAVHHCQIYLSVRYTFLLLQACDFASAYQIFHPNPTEPPEHSYDVISVFQGGGPAAYSESTSGFGFSVGTRSVSTPGTCSLRPDCQVLRVIDIYGVVLNMEEVTKDLLVHQTHAIYVYGNPQTVPAIDGNGIKLNGLNQYLDAGKDIICKNNLDDCERGFTLRFQIKPFQLADRTYFISSAPIDIYYRWDMMSVFVSQIDQY